MVVVSSFISWTTLLDLLLVKCINPTVKVRFFTQFAERTFAAGAASRYNCVLGLLMRTADLVCSQFEIIVD